MHGDRCSLVNMPNLNNSDLNQLKFFFFVHFKSRFVRMSTQCSFIQDKAVHGNECYEYNSASNFVLYHSDLNHSDLNQLKYFFFSF